ncbi:hypothetical protein A2U01_0084268, partial [Trifolium medium]|nr:hypothetical protein [Trifolium medium]
TFWSLQGNNTKGLLTQRLTSQKHCFRASTSEAEHSESAFCFQSLFLKTRRQDSSEPFQRACFSWIFFA